MISFTGDKDSCFTGRKVTKPLRPMWGTGFLNVTLDGSRKATPRLCFQTSVTQATGLTGLSWKRRFAVSGISYGWLVLQNHILTIVLSDVCLRCFLYNSILKQIRQLLMYRNGTELNILLILM